MGVDRGENARPGDVTRLLGRMSRGDREAASALYEHIYTDLQRIARLQLRGQSDGHTLRTVGLVSEVYLRLASRSELRWKDRQHFMAVAGRAMRSVLVDHARRRKRQKRGGGAKRVTLDGLLEHYGARVGDLLDLEEALCRLGEEDEQAARVVELRFFSGLSIPEIANLMELSSRTVDRIWNHSRAWLHRHMSR